MMDVLRADPFTADEMAFGELKCGYILAFLGLTLTQVTSTSQHFLQEAAPLLCAPTIVGSRACCCFSTFSG